MSNATANGRLPRKQLADQLDRFDSILDGLSEALNEAVADAARVGAGAAVKEVLTEILTNPKFAGMFHAIPSAAPKPEPAPAAKPAPKPSLWSKLRGRAKDLAANAKAANAKLVSKAGTILKPVGSVLDVLRLTGGLKKAVLIAAFTGVLIGGVSLACPQWMAAALGALAGTVTALAVQAGIAVRGLVARFRMI